MVPAGLTPGAASGASRRAPCRRDTPVLFRRPAKGC